MGEVTKAVVDWVFGLIMAVIIASVIVVVVSTVTVGIVYRCHLEYKHKAADCGCGGKPEAK